MMKPSFTNRIFSFACLLVMALVASIGGVVANVWAGETWHTMPGTACAAFNNNQGNMLQRTHRRLYNPLTNTHSVWVICPIQAVEEDVQSTTESVQGRVNIYFDSSVLDSVTCIIREYYDRVFSFEPELINSDIAIADSRPDGPFSQHDFQSQNFIAPFSFTNDGYPYLYSPAYWVATCKLLPGTGVNSFSVHQR